MHRAGKTLTSATFARLLPGALSVVALAAVGCGSNYRPVVSAINPVGPAGQPTKYAVAISNPGTNLPGLVTVVDFAGDTVLATPSILANPTYFTLGNGGSQAYVINASGALDTFPVINPAALITSAVSQTNLAAGANPVSVTAFAASGGANIFIPQASTQPSIAALTSNGPSLLQNIAVPPNPTYVVGAAGATRAYALSAGTGGNGTATAIETTTSLPTVSNAIPVGVNPVYGVISSDLSRAFILNKGSSNVSVINVTANVPDSSLSLINTGAAGVGASNPVWAELVPTLTELLVLNAGNGTTPGSLSVISIPACNAITPVPSVNCLPPTYTDAVGFGTILATVPVGVNPVMVSALSDGSRAYVANQLDPAHCNAGEGSVSVVNLRSNSVTATICGISTAAGTTDVNTTPSLIYGHPNSISATLASPTGKVYVTSGDSRFLSVLRTDTDAMQTHIPLQGLGLRVLVTAP